MAGGEPRADWSPGQAGWMHKRWDGLLGLLRQLAELTRAMTRVMERMTGVEERLNERVAALERRVAELEARQEPPADR
jgi:uncharacterized protein YceH (UPF0502 family)